ncbi:MAG: hypothetical protein L0Y66_19930 [Myxococcaceae bacterium]|nr:hypothetical protein [Myxococcaceae bacterium]MCI0671994.1 hypothetical protein [Myxococcaceae bacterium]
MKRYLGLLLGVVVVLVLIQRVYASGRDKAAAAEREGAFARIQREYLERVGWLRVNPDEQAYRDDVKSFLRWYFGEVDAHVKHYRLNADFDDYLHEVEARAANGKDEQLEKRKAYYASVKKLFDGMRAGTYRPMWTASDKGMRLDVLDAQVQAVDGHPRVVLPLVLWGAQRTEREEARNLRKVVASANFDALIRLFDAKGKQIGEVPISGGPDMRVDHPERLIKEFPAQLVLGRYELPLVPAEVTRMEVTVNVTTSPEYGRPAQAAFAWKVDVPAEWKLRPGEAWEGAEVVEREEADPSAADAR